jgi:hypothetical protein
VSVHIKGVSSFPGPTYTWLILSFLTQVHCALIMKSPCLNLANLCYTFVILPEVRWDQSWIKRCLSLLAFFSITPLSYHMDSILTQLLNILDTRHSFSPDKPHIQFPLVCHCLPQAARSPSPKSSRSLKGSTAHITLWTNSIQVYILIFPNHQLSRASNFTTR